jgi:hypothetical protein
LPSRAFVPAPLTEAQPRVYRSFRGRQLQGILLGAGGAVISLAVFGMSDFIGYALAFAAALPGFAYGYYQPQGKPVEYWVRVLLRYYLTPQVITAHPSGGRRWRLFAAQIKPTVWAAWWVLKPRRKERRADER